MNATKIETKFLVRDCGWRDVPLMPFPVPPNLGRIWIRMCIARASDRPNEIQESTKTYRKLNREYDSYFAQEPGGMWVAHKTWIHHRNRKMSVRFHAKNLAKGFFLFAIEPHCVVVRFGSVQSSPVQFVYFDFFCSILVLLFGSPFHLCKIQANLWILCGEEIMEAHWPASATQCPSPQQYNAVDGHWKWWNNCLAGRVVWFSMSPPPPSMSSSSTTTTAENHIVRNPKMHAKHTMIINPMKLTIVLPVWQLPQFFFFSKTKKTKNKNSFKLKHSLHGVRTLAQRPAARFFISPFGNSLFLHTFSLSSFFLFASFSCSQRIVNLVCSFFSG